MPAALPGEVFDLPCKTGDLMPRQRHLVALMLALPTTSELADALYISTYTVQDQRAAISAKTRLGSRCELILCLTGRRCCERRD